jgi:hypothetical protein
MDDVPSDGGLRDLLSDAIDEAEAVITSLRGVAPPAGDEGHVWRWALMYLVLGYDLGGSALALSDGSHNRALLILRRAIFEHMTRLRYYRMHPEIACAHLEDFERLAKLFQRRIDDDAFQLILDSAFNAAAHDRQKRNFEEIVKDVHSGHADDFYARFYTYPSALVHGDALAFMDVLEMHTDGTWELHGSSRRKNTDKDVLFNYVAFFIGVLQDALEQFGMDLAGVFALRQRLDSAGQALAMEPV